MTNTYVDDSSYCPLAGKEVEVQSRVDAVTVTDTVSVTVVVLSCSYHARTSLRLGTCSGPSQLHNSSNSSNERPKRGRNISVFLFVSLNVYVDVRVQERADRPLSIGLMSQTDSDLHTRTSTEWMPIAIEDSM
jgi:hypothetical protein